jgi:hypothetical protein
LIYAISSLDDFKNYSLSYGYCPTALRKAAFLLSRVS